MLLLWPGLREGMQGERPRIERSRPGAIPAPPAAPELSWLLSQRDALRLNAAQVRKLRSLKTRWDRETGALREALDRASARFNREMASRIRTGGGIQELRERSGPVSDLSRRLAGTRRTYWAEASAILTEPQRRQAEEAWTRRLAGGRAASSPH